MVSCTPFVLVLTYNGLYAIIIKQYIKEDKLSWTHLTELEKDDLVFRRYALKEDVADLASETGINVVSLDRYLRKHKAEKGDEILEDEEKAVRITVKPSEGERPRPTNNDLFNVLKRGPVQLSALMDRFDRSEKTIRGWLDELKKDGYVITEEHRTAHIDTKSQPKVEYVPAKTLADERGQEIVFAAASDLHAGSTHSQPSAYKKFIELAYYDYGVRDVFDPGDKTTGVGGYRGQEHDIVPAIRPLGRNDFYRSTLGQVWLADHYSPKLPGLTYYNLGGNHDAWHINKSGIDAVRMLSDQRDDMVYLGYDVNDIPLTDKASIRLWHPGGGAGYALSYRLQKGMEQMALEELYRALESNSNPNVRIILAGHLHVEVKFQRGPLAAAHVGCFEGQTNYLKRKGLYPSVGGAIFRVRLSDGGLIQRLEYTFIPFTEVMDDWKNFEVPPEDTEVFESVTISDPIFSLRG